MAVHYERMRKERHTKCQLWRGWGFSFNEGNESLFSKSHTSTPFGWFWSHRPSTVVYVQDVVHMAVKLQSHLIKPSVLLPMGSFVAGVHHLQILPKKHLEKMYMDLENETLIIKIGKILMLFYIYYEHCH